MTDEKVNEFEAALREAEAAVEKAGRIICPERGEEVTAMRVRIGDLIAGIQEAMHQAYKLRDWGDGGNG